MSVYHMICSWLERMLRWRRIRSRERALTWLVRETERLGLYE
jgi:hypothetical protein